MNFLLVIALTVAQAPDDAELLAKIEASYKKQQPDVKTLYCEAKVDSFYAKGFFTRDDKIRSKDPASIEDNPDADVRIKGESVVWRYDFEKQNLRVIDETTIRAGDSMSNVYALVKDHITASFVQGRERSIRDKNKSDIFKFYGQDDLPVEMTEGSVWLLRGHIDSVILWNAGRASTVHKWQNLNELELTKKCKIIGETKFSGNDCVIMIENGAEKRSRQIEYWIDAKSPYLLRRVFMENKEAKHLFWDMRIEYDESVQLIVPKRIQMDEYFLAEKRLQSQQVYQFKTYQPNKQFTPADFDDKGKPGMIARKRGVRGMFKVNASGELEPFDPKEKAK